MYPQRIVNAKVTSKLPSLLLLKNNHRIQSQKDKPLLQLRSIFQHHANNRGKKFGKKIRMRTSDLNAEHVREQDKKTTLFRLKTKSKFKAGRNIMTIIHNLLNTLHRCSEKRFTTMSPFNHTELNSTLFHRKRFRQTYRQERTFQN